MTDDSKEYMFNSVVRWLRESNYIVSDEKHTIVTSEFFANIVSPENSAPSIELVSAPSLGDGIMFQIRLANLQERFEKLDTTGLKKDIENEKEIANELTENRIFLSVSEKDLLLQKVYSPNPQIIESRNEIVDIVNALQYTSKNIMKWIHLNFKDK